MATIVLQAAGAVVGGLVGGPIGAIVGRALGATVGAVIDHSLFATGGKNTVGPRLTTLAGLTSTEGAAVPRIYGRARIGGQMIWATRFEETTNVQHSGGGKGGGGASQTTYDYFANFAVGLCEGPVAQIRRVWADGTELDLSTISMRVYNGDETQAPDPLIVAKEGAENAPAYRGLAYVVFERLPLSGYGNRVPQLSFEVLRPIDGLGRMIRGVDLIPGASEFAYSPTAILDARGLGMSRWENRHQLFAPTDWAASIDTLQALCPNLRSVALVVSWFGDDLRAGHCTIAPRVENQSKVIAGVDWNVDGVTRPGARVVSWVDGAPAYGGTPSDDGVKAAIADLRARGLSVVFYPFVMMDVPPGNALPDPWSGAASQPAFPWRGRITCDPAPGRAGTPDATSIAASQVGAFFGSITPGAEEFSFRRFILHYARLCADAGGVDAFLIGSELRALTHVRSASGIYPAANALATLASDVKTIVGATTKVSYSADWTEYGAHVLSGGAEARFPLDIVWSSPSIDFVGIDAYWPLSDWRDGGDHLDAGIARSVHDVDYLQSRVASGEGYDWYYASDAARDAQTRALITDGLANKPWMFRSKDLVGWWSNPHVERVGNVERSMPTAWIPAGKPIWLMEYGCPAVDRGANQPNLFPDPKSSEAGLPFYSRGYRDDLMQSRALEAIIGHFNAGGATANPISPIYGGPMVDPARIHAWAWDARPFPAFPGLSGVWSDAGNWDTGHWLNGRLEGIALDRLVKTIIDESRPDAAPIARPPIDGHLDGYALDKVISARAAIEPLAALYGFDAIASGGALRFAGRASRAAIAIGEDDIAPGKTGELVTLTRAQESEVPNEIGLTFTNGDVDYRSSAVLSRRLEGGSRRQSAAEAAVVTDVANAQHLLDIWLRDLWVSRETSSFVIRPGLIALEVGDAVSITIDGRARLFRIAKITDGMDRAIEARAIEPSVFDAGAPVFKRQTIIAPLLPGPPFAVALDLAIVRAEPATLQYLAVSADPWPGPLALWKAQGESSFAFVKTIERRAILGATLDAVGPGVTGRIDNANIFRVSVSGGILSSVTDVQMFAGANAAALRGPDGAWEIIGFANAQLVGAGEWRLSRLLRGLGGADALARRTLAAGATFVLLDKAVVPLAAGLTELGIERRWRLGPANRDHSDASYIEFTTSAGNVALKPYAPVRATAVRSTAGVTISFTRRGRVDSDAWEPVDIPLGEDAERYEVEILSSGVVTRVLSSTAPSVLYGSADEVADFGAAAGALDIRVYQMSASVGRGFPLAAHVVIR
jgi:hypothetical protein